MRALALLVALSIAGIAAPAFAQQSLIAQSNDAIDYACSLGVDGGPDGATGLPVEMRIGPGVFQMRAGGDWSENICKQAGTACSSDDTGKVFADGGS
jgi:hypothetical protein